MKSIPSADTSKGVSHEAGLRVQQPEIIICCTQIFTRDLKRSASAFVAPCISLGWDAMRAMAWPALLPSPEACEDVTLIFAGCFRPRARV